MKHDQISATLKRPLTEEDITSLDDRPPVKAPLTRIASQHHRMARLIAEGMRPGDVALACGILPSTISIMQENPVFMELVEFYRRQVDEQYINLHERLAGIAEDAAAIISERMQENPDDLETDTLVTLVKMGADRTGHGPTSTQNTNVNISIGARLEAARQRMKLINPPLEIEHGRDKPSDES